MTLWSNLKNLRKLTEEEKRNFKCLHCGNCCKGEGVVHINDEDAIRISHFLEMSIERVISCRAVTKILATTNLHSSWQKFSTLLKVSL